MFELPGLRRLQFYAGEFAIETIEDADRQGDGDGGAEMACREKDRGSPRDDVAENGQLIGRDAGFAELADDEGLDGSVGEGREYRACLFGRRRGSRFSASFLCPGVGEGNQ